MGAGASAKPVTRIKDIEPEPKDAFEEEEEEKLNATNDIKIPLINKSPSPEVMSEMKSEASTVKGKKGKPFVFSPRWNDNSERKKKDSIELPPLLIPPSQDKDKQGKKVHFLVFYFFFLLLRL